MQREGKNRVKKFYRALNFDLKLKLLKQYYPKKNFLNAYRDIKSFMTKNGFSHRQWSGYRSNEKLTDAQIGMLMLEMRETLPWVEKCSTKIDITNIGKMYDIKGFYNLHDKSEEDKDIEKDLRESEIKESKLIPKNVKSLEELIKGAEKIVKASNKSISKNRELETYVR